MTDARAPGVLCVGRLYCDLVFSDLPRMPTMGQEVFAGALSLHSGGGAVITAAHLVQTGRPAHLAAFWPAAPFETQVKEEVAAAGIGHRFCQSSGERDPQITVAISGATDRAFLTRRVGAAVPRLTVEDLQAMRVGHLHIGELATLVEMPSLISLARAAGLTVSLDCSWDDGVTADVAALIAKVDVFFPNEEEIAQLNALGLTAPFAPLTVVKRGGEGAVILSCAGQSHAAPGHRVNVVDTTGAGDAFNAGFLHQWLNGASMEACLAAANDQGALAVQHKGGFAIAATVPSDTAFQ